MGFIEQELNKIEKWIKRTNITLWKLLEYKQQLTKISIQIMEMGKNNLVEYSIIEHLLNKRMKINKNIDIRIKNYDEKKLKKADKKVINLRLGKEQSVVCNICWKSDKLFYVKINWNKKIFCKRCLRIKL